MHSINCIEFFCGLIANIFISDLINIIFILSKFHSMKKIITQLVAIHFKSTFSMEENRKVTLQTDYGENSRQMDFCHLWIYPHKQHINSVI